MRRAGVRKTPGRRMLALIPGIVCSVLCWTLMPTPAVAFRIVGDDELAQLAVAWGDTRWTPWTDCHYTYSDPSCRLCDVEKCSHCEKVGEYKYVKNCSGGVDFHTRNCITRPTGGSCDPAEYPPLWYKCCQWWTYPDDTCTNGRAWQLFAARETNDGKSVLGMEDDCWDPGKDPGG